jgi:leucine-rich repeat protein SHOC2
MLNVLNLRNGQFHSLPDELGDLMNLVCLDLSNCHNLERLPNTVRNLQELKFLILDDCWSLKYLPSGVVDLTSLQVLHTAQCSSLIWAENALSWAVRAGVSGHLHITVGASLENVCRLLFLTELTISTKELFDIPELFKQFRDEVANNIYSPTTLQFVQLSQLDMELPHNFSSLTKLLLLQLTLEIKTLPAEIAYCQQLQELEVFSTILECIPRSFTSCGAFPALIKLQLCSLKLLQFPEMDAGAMCKLQILNLSNCQRLEILPLSLQVLTSLRNLILVDCNNKLQNCCRRNCARSAIWRKFNIQYEQSSPTENDNERKYTFHSRHNLQLTVMNVEWRM